MQCAVIGLYRSGSSATAGLLHRLGVDMGIPYFGDYYESEDVSAALREWWQEPLLEESSPAIERQEWLAEWLQRRRQGGSEEVGIKHPLLCLSAVDLEQAWGGETKFIRTCRDKRESIESLERLAWWPNHEERIQNQLWQAAEEFFHQRSCLEIPFEQLISRPAYTTDQLVEYLGIDVSTRRRLRAASSIKSRAASSSHPQETPPARSRQSQIAATMLSGNSQDQVADAVRSVIDYVDVLLLIDTGITDGTREIVERLAGDKFQLAKFDWTGDFAEARNVALRLAARLDMDWVVTIDTDERLVFPDDLTIDRFKALLESEPKVEAWFVDALDQSYAKERMVRLPSALQWRGATHEALVGGGKGSRARALGVFFSELPKDEDRMQAKLERDLEVLTKEVQSKPNNARWHYYLGQTFEGLKRHREAIDAYLKAGQLSDWQEESAWSFFCAARSMSELKEYRNAVGACAAGLARQPGSPELAWLAGWCCFKEADIANAIQWSQIAISLGSYRGNGCVKSRIAFKHLPAAFEGPFDVLRYCYRIQKKEALAAQADRDFEAAGKMRQGTE